VNNCDFCGTFLWLYGKVICSVWEGNFSYGTYLQNTFGIVGCEFYQLVFYGLIYKTEVYAPRDFIILPNITTVAKSISENIIWLGV